MAPARSRRETGAMPSEQLTMVRGMGFLFAAGATLNVITLLLPGGGHRMELTLALAAVASYCVAVAVLAFEERVAPAAVHALLVFGSLLVTLCVIVGGGAGTGYALYYVWVALYAAYFLRPRAVAAHTTLAGALAGLAFAVQDDIRAPAAHWVMGVGTATVLAMLVSHLARSMRGQRTDLATAAALTGDPGALEGFRERVCERLRSAARADSVALLEPVGDGHGDGLAVSGGSAEPPSALGAPRARIALERCLAEGRQVVILAGDRPASGLTLLRRSVAGLAQPVLSDGVPVGVLALAWRRPRRAVSQRTAAAAFVLASTAGRLLERLERLNRERERRALEINDGIVQGLVVAKYAMAAGNATEAVRAVDETLEAARRLVTAQLDEVAAGAVRPGDLVRGSALP
jgi:signal transduction histidine kinase